VVKVADGEHAPEAGVVEFVVGSEAGVESPDEWREGGGDGSGVSGEDGAVVHPGYGYLPVGHLPSDEAHGGQAVGVVEPDGELALVAVLEVGRGGDYLEMRNF